MKLLSFRRPDGSASWGAVIEGGVADLSARAPSLRHALADGVALDAAHADFPLDAIRFLPPIPDPDKILCVGLNYMTHIREGGREPPAKPIIFTRFANTQVGHLEPLIRPRASETLDFEGEVAVVIGRRCRHVPRAGAMSVVAGYSCYNDGSVREWQRHTSQFTPGKNFVHTGGFGPWLVTPDETGPIERATLITRLNGEEMQRAGVDDLVFDVPALIEYCSTFTELVPGDVIVTGTTGGVGAYRTPPLWMKPGDVVEVEVTSVGVLRNTIEDEA
jgi:2-keto-4-pentenoate hydratase/2-oxohepta-3-ene-1,7-dioic acid hydratase in catechol pathway